MGKKYVDRKKDFSVWWQITEGLPKDISLKMRKYVAARRETSLSNVTHNLTANFFGSLLPAYRTFLREFMYMTETQGMDSKMKKKHKVVDWEEGRKLLKYDKNTRRFYFEDWRTDTNGNDNIS